MSSAPPQTDIVIVGAGIAGLAAGFELRRRGYENFRLLEAAERPGGVVSTAHLAGIPIEEGPDSFLTEKPAALELCRELGLGEQLIPSHDAARRTWIWRKHRLRALPEGWQMLAPARPLALWRSNLLSWPAKARIAREFFSSARAPETEISVGALVRSRLGAEVLDVVVAPLLSGVYGGDADELSLDAVLPRLAQMARQGSLGRGLWRARRRRGANTGAARPLFTTLQNGLSECITALAARLESHIETHCRVSRITKSGEGYQLECHDQAPGSPAGRIPQIHCRKLILALPAWAAAELLRELDGELAAQLAAVPYASSLTINLAYSPAPPLPDGFGVLIPPGEGLRMRACTFIQQKFPARVPAGRALLRVFYGGVRDSEALALSDEELLALATGELRTILGLKQPPAAGHIRRWPRAMAQYTVGHGGRQQRVQAALARHAGLALAGNAYRGIGISDCIESGYAAARKLIHA